MKWSIYNELIQRDGKDGFILYNSLWEKYFALDGCLLDIIKQDKNNISVIANIHPELYNQLLMEKFVVSEATDEVELCIQKLNKKFGSKSEIRITINPTLDCNLRCWYCYESRIKGSCMKSDTINALISFVKKQCETKDIEKIHLSFFGGEPLLKYNQVVRPIVSGCLNTCNAYNKVLVLSFTTNGVCLTSHVIDDLLNMGITYSIQVAFDGNKKTHDSIKCFSNGSGSYDIVRKHLNYAIEKGILTTIRCNYTKTSIESFMDLINDFKSYWHHTNVRFSFHKVWQEPESQELFQKRELLKDFVKKTGVKSNINSFFGNSIIPCYADFENNIIVNYNGDIFKCTARDFKKSHRLGHLETDGNITYDDTAIDTCVETKFTKQCRTCRLLPICTICFQQRKESVDRKCPMPTLYENASENIQKYFYDIINLQDS